METKNIILKLRTERGMSQDELADKIMVTRQAVSRWENGDTVPNTDTLKLLSKEFDVSINTLLGEPRKLICQCCGMPIDDDSILGRDTLPPYAVTSPVRLWRRRGCWERSRSRRWFHRNRASFCGEVVGVCGYMLFSDRWKCVGT